VAWENDVPLETVRDRCEPLGSDGMWTKRGPGRAAQRPGTVGSLGAQVGV